MLALQNVWSAAEKKVFSAVVSRGDSAEERYPPFLTHVV